MARILPKEALRPGNSYHAQGGPPQQGNSVLFQGEDYGNIPLSFFWVHAAPGTGPQLHQHPYEEIFVIEEGRATFTIGERTFDVESGHVVIAPAGVPHTFINSGEGILRQLTLHPRQAVITEWLES